MVEPLYKECPYHGDAIEYLCSNGCHCSTHKAHSGEVELAKDEQVIEHNVDYCSYNGTINEGTGTANGDKERIEQLAEHKERQAPYAEVNKIDTERKVAAIVQAIAEEEGDRPEGEHHEAEGKQHGEHSAIREYLGKAFFIALPRPAGHLYLHATAEAIAYHAENEKEYAGDTIHAQLPHAKAAQEYGIGKEAQLRYEQRQ